MIERVKEFPSLTIIRHPLVQHKLTILRDHETQTKHFKELVDEIAMLMAYEATQDLSPAQAPHAWRRGVRVSYSVLTGSTAPVRADFMVCHESVAHFTRTGNSRTPARATSLPTDASSIG